MIRLRDERREPVCVTPYGLTVPEESARSETEPVLARSEEAVMAPSPSHRRGSGELAFPPSSL